MNPRFLLRCDLRLFKMAALIAMVVVSTSGLLTAAYAADPIKVTQSVDKYAKVTTLTTEKFSVPDVGSFFDPAFAYAWLNTIIDPGFAPSVGLHVYFQRGNGWRFFDRAIDSDGKTLSVDVLARDVQYGSTVVEQFMVKLPVTYLQSHRDTGLDIRFDGKGGSLVVPLPASYVQAMLDQLGAQVQSPPTSSSASVNASMVNNPNDSTTPAVAKASEPTLAAPQKLRLGIRYMDEATAAHMPPALRAKLPVSGLFVVRVELSSPAAVAGFTTGDVLVEFAGTIIKSPADMATALDKVPPGSKVEATVVRGGQAVRLGVQM